MFDLNNFIGVKSYSFRTITDNVECARTIRDNCKSNVVDLSGCHVNYDAPETWAQVVAAYNDNGVTIAGNGVVLVKPDDAWNRRYFEFAKLAKSELLSITFMPEDMDQTISSIEKLSEEYGILTAIHNHGGYNWLGNLTAMNYVLNKSSKRIGLCLDTAWSIQTELERPVEWMEKFADRMYGIHFKDFIWERNGKHVDSIVGEGSLELADVLAKFKEMEHIKSAVLEYEGPETVECTRKSIEIIREMYQ